jgi:hypothetical protein
MVTRTAWAALVSVVATACTLPEEPIADVHPVVVVQAVLDLGASNQAVTVRWSDAGLGSDANITDATVSLIASSGTTIAATSRENGRYSIPTPAGFLVPGATYTIRVHLLTGEQVTGTATLPTAPLAIPGPVESFVRTRDTVRLAWAPVVGAAAYEVRVYLSNGGSFPFGDPTFTRFVHDTAITLPGTLQRFLDDGDVFRIGRRATVIVSAIDENYYQSMRVFSDPLAGVPPSRLTGGEGVFGAIVPIVIAPFDIR